MNFFDLVIVGIVLLGGLAGYRKGLIGAVMGAASSIIAIFIAFSTYKVFSPILSDKFGLGKIIVGILKSVIKLPEIKSEPIVGNGLGQLGVISDLLPQPLRVEFGTMFSNMMDSAISAKIQNVGDAIIQYLSLAVVSMIAFFLIFIVVKLLLGFVSSVISKQFKHGVIGSVNNSGGFIAGAMASILFIAIVLGFLAPLFSFTADKGVLKTLSTLMQDSLLTPLFQKVFSGLSGLLGGMLT